MISSVFVEKLKQLAPLPSELVGRGLSNDFIDYFIRRYICLPRIRLNKFYNKGAIFNLINEYDCSTMEIANISFVQSVIEKDNYYQVGNLEQDILSINKISLEIEVLDFAEPRHRIWSCASNQENFLDALLLCADFYTKKVKSQLHTTDHTHALEIAYLCSEKAGGTKYLDFYEMLLIN